MENTKITKTEKLQKIETILTAMEQTEETKMLVEFVQSEQAALARKAAKAKEKAAEKKTEIDALGEAVLAVLTGEPKTRDEIFALVEDFDKEVSIAKVGARLTKLVDAGKAEKTEVKSTTASGKKSTRMAYALALTEAEPVEVDE